MKRISLYLTILLFSFQANADYLFAPYFGYVRGQEEVNNASKNMQGVLGGMKLGVDFDIIGLAGGLDFLLGTYDYDPGVGDFDTKKLGFFLRFNFPQFIQLSASYFPLDSTSFETDSVYGKYKGYGVKWGFGLTVIPMMTLSMEYMVSFYDEYEGRPLSQEAHHNTFLFLITIPVTFPAL